MAGADKGAASAETAPGTTYLDSVADAFDVALGEELEDEETGEEEQLDSDDSGTDEENPEDADEEGVEDEEGTEEEEDAELGADESEKPKTKPLPDDAQVFTIDNPDGTTTTVTKAEARAGYLRHKDYTQKTMAAAEIRKAAEQEKAIYGGLVGEYRKYLDTILKNEPTAEQWEKLRTEDPQAYLLRKEEFRNAQAERVAAEAEQQRLAKEENQKNLVAFSEHMQKENDLLLTALPKWKADPAFAKREADAIYAHLTERGFTDDQIKAGMTDHRMVLLVRDAALLAQMRAKARGTARPAPKKTLQPGTTPTKGTGLKKGFRQAKADLVKTGSPKDAGRAMEHLLNL